MKNDEKGFKIVFLGDGKSDFQLELTWLKDRTEPYDLGDLEYHLAFIADDFEAAGKSIGIWTVSVLKILIWVFILSAILMDIGLKSFQKNKY